MNTKFYILYIATLFIAGTAAGQKAFTEVSQQAGINHYFEVDLATFGGGAAVVDFDNDGWEDLYVTGGKSPDAFYKNNGDGTFTNVIDQMGFERTAGMYTQGASAADINRDGFKDLIVTSMYHFDSGRSLAPNLLYLNNGDGTFTDVTEKYGLAGFENNSQGATFGDINADGFPDLYVSNYFNSSPMGVSIFNEFTITNSFVASEDFLFINVEGQYFIDARTIYGFNFDGFGFEGMFTDFDNDRDLDLYITNDFGFKNTPNLLLRNDFPQKKFTDRSVNLAMNFGMNAMGVAACDYNFDGWMDYFVTNLSTSLFTVNQKDGKPFANMTFASGLAIPTIVDEAYVGPPISWGANFFDYDHDMDMDLFVSNGALNPTIRLNPNFFFECENERFTEVATRMELNDYQIGRGSVVFDYDNDGDLDLFVVNQKPRDVTSSLPEPRCLLYRNETVSGNWLKVRLEGGIQAGMDGIGSRVELKVGDRLLIREIDGGSSHLSQNSTIAHFGVGDVTKIDSLIVKWVGGKTQVMTGVDVNRQITVKESPERFSLFDHTDLTIYPSYFTDNVTIEYTLDNDQPIRLDVVDANGRKVALLDTSVNPVNQNLFSWRVPVGVTPGMYFFRLVVGDKVMIKKGIKL